MMYASGPPLSLETFEPSEAKAPFLNTPRSIEACRRLGVRPVELVELSVQEFQKEFPNDPMAAQKRYERIEGARRLLLEDVRSEWKMLVQSGWRPNKHRPLTSSSVRETIIPITAEIGHSTLLELQAEEFRRIEMGEWNKLQRMLYMNVKNAENEQRLNKIVAKHEEIALKNDNFQHELTDKKKKALQEQLDRQKQKEIDEERDLKAYQKKCMEEHKVQKLLDEEKEHKAKLLREKLEKDRLDREEYTRSLKESIVEKINTGIRKKEKSLLEREAEATKRLELEAEARRRELKEKSDELAYKIVQTKTKIFTTDEKRREELENALKEDDKKRKELLQAKEQQRLRTLLGDAANSSSGAGVGIGGVPISKQRSEAIIQKKKEMEASFCQKAKFDLDVKDASARHELHKVKNLLEERRLQKAIRQEGHDICKLRKEKALLYKEEQIRIAVEEKSKRSEAIRNGYIQLKRMKGAMKDIMTRATVDLKEDMQRLHKRGELNPDKVIERALHVSENNLFPKLSRTFGVTPKEELLTGGPSMSSGNRPMTAPNSRKNKINEIESSFGPASSMHDSTLVKNDRPVSPGTDPNARILQSTLSLQLFDKDALVSSLNETKVKVAKNNLLETKTRKAGDYSKKGGAVNSMKESASSSIIDKAALNEDSYEEDVNVPMDNGEVFYSFSYNNQDHENLSLSYNPDGLSKLQSSSKLSDNYNYNDNNSKQRVKSAKARFTPTKEDEFRREFSSDHPLANAKSLGKYKAEQAEGLKPASGARTEKEIVLDTLVRPVKEKMESKYFDDISSDVAELSKRAFKDIESLKKRQNEYMLNVIEEERAAEEYREKCLKDFNGSNKQKMDGHHEILERKKLENIFTEQRQRASDRIMKLTKEHEANIREMVLNALIKEHKR